MRHTRLQKTRGVGGARSARAEPRTRQLSLSRIQRFLQAFFSLRFSRNPECAPILSEAAADERAARRSGGGGARRTAAMLAHPRGRTHASTSWTARHSCSRSTSCRREAAAARFSILGARVVAQRRQITHMAERRGRGPTMLPKGHVHGRRAGTERGTGACARARARMGGGERRADLRWVPCPRSLRESSRCT